MTNRKAKDKDGKAVGIENLYSDTLFTADVYTTETRPGAYGATTSITTFDKQKFLSIVQAGTSPDTFENFKPLIAKIKELLAPN